ncbi:fungal specific transcription factor [Pyrenophora seminiperda CCB06]|uniref:Fungal specific transcription factor n=1 Tax=Pyrenophora seminiperda CCB06 TaxID=1302712 RepID=A0A3M7M2C9_9PLEO|nr:fungal specific transcription factor [Pyrenophora seminiperda CCB06]
MRVSSKQHTTKEPSSGATNSSQRKQQPQQQRQLLSCTKCRERKVKCDRTKPCSACCVRGSPRDCHFIAEDGNYAPIRQSYELRKLRAENLRLKEKLHALRIPVDGEDLKHARVLDSQFGERPPSWHKRKQQSFPSFESHENIYFGSPGLATVVNEFATTNTNISTTLAYVMPRPSDIFATGNSSTYPFATIFSASLEDCIPQLLGCLPRNSDMSQYLSVFEKQVCAQMPVELTRSEIERFLSDAEENSKRCPTMLGLLLVVIALGAQHSVWGRNSDSWDADLMKAETRAGDVYSEWVKFQKVKPNFHLVAAAMQALRLSSFMHKPSLLAIQVLVMIGKYLTNTGKYLDAFTLFGTTIRLAHAIGLHCHSKYLDPSPPTVRDVSKRQKIWWYMLRIDEEFSMTLGRPLGISGIGTCSWPQELATDPNVLRFGEYINRFTLLARQILSSDRLTNPRIDEFTDAVWALSDTLPDTLRFEDSWANPEITLPLGSWPLSAMAAGMLCTLLSLLWSNIQGVHYAFRHHSPYLDASEALFFEVQTVLLYPSTGNCGNVQFCSHNPVYYCKTHTYLILLNRQRIEKHTSPSAVLNSTATISSFIALDYTPSIYPSQARTMKASLRGRSLVIASSENIIAAFLFFYRREPSALIDWTIGQQAFNSCMILLLDAIERRVVTVGSSKAEEALNVFKILDEKNVHKLAGRAVERIEKGLKQLHDTVTQLNSRDYQSRAQRGINTISLGAEDNEAMAGFGGVDTVMSCTGMLLVEDAGLQAFEKESFSPTIWGIPGPPTVSKQEFQTAPHRNKVEQESIENLQILQLPETKKDSDLRRSDTLHSASTRLAVPMGDHMQPNGYTAPTSPTDIPGPHERHSMITSEPHGWRKTQCHRTASPPHSQNQWHQPGVLGYSGWQCPRSLDVYSGEEQHTSPPCFSIDTQQSAEECQRYISCPELPQSVLSPTLLCPTPSSPNSVEPSPGPQLLSPYFYSKFHPKQTVYMGNESLQRYSLVGHEVNTPVSSIAEVVPRNVMTIHGNSKWQQGQVDYSPFTQPCDVVVPSASTVGTNIEEWQHAWSKARS